MSEENLAVVFEHIDAINRGDVEAVVATVSPDVEWEDAMFYSESPRIYRGKGEVREWFHRVLEPWESFHAEPDKIREASDGRILVGGTITARGKASGVETRLSGWFLFWVADGIITKRRPFLDYDEALEAAGLRE